MIVDAFLFLCGVSVAFARLEIPPSVGEDNPELLYYLQKSGSVMWFVANFRYLCGRF